MEFPVWFQTGGVAVCVAFVVWFGWFVVTKAFPELQTKHDAAQKSLQGLFEIALDKVLAGCKEERAENSKNLERIVQSADRREQHLNQLINDQRCEFMALVESISDRFLTHLSVDDERKVKEMHGFKNEVGKMALATEKVAEKLGTSTTNQPVSQEEKDKHKL